MNPLCESCRYMTRFGCRVGICGAVRSQIRGGGWTFRGGTVVKAAPEPVGPDDLAAYLVKSEDDTFESAPTREGYIEARGREGKLLAEGKGAEMVAMRRNLDQTPTRASQNQREVVAAHV